jgi:hypothetical protein
MEDIMTQISTANTSSEMVRSAPTTALRVAARNLELYDTGDVAGADEVFAPGLVDHTPVAGAASGIEAMRALIAAVRTDSPTRSTESCFSRSFPTAG